MKKSKNFGFVFIGENNSNQLRNKINVQKTLIKELIKKKANVYFLNLSFINSKNRRITKNYTIEGKYNCKHVKFSCKKDFIEFCDKNKIYLILWLPFNINLKIFNCWMILKKINSKLIYINEENRPDDKYYTLSLNKRILSFFNFNRIHKILVFLKFFPSIDYYLSTNLKNYSQSNKNNFLDKIKNNLFSNIKNKILIKNKLINYKIQKSEKYITFLDTAFYDHPAIKNQDQSNRKKFFEKLRYKLNYMSKYFKKEVIICAHPKSDKKKIFQDFKGFKIKYYQTENYIAQAYVVIFFFTSSIWLSVALNKPVIQLSEDNLHKLWILRIKQFQNIFSFIQLNIDDFITYKMLKILYKNAQKKIFKYDKFKKKYLNSQKKSVSSALFDLK